LLLLGTPAIANTACRIGWLLRSVITQRIDNNYFFNYFTRMTKRDIYISKIILSSINRELSQKNLLPWDGMGWDKKNVIPWDGTILKTFRPIPSHGT